MSYQKTGARCDLSVIYWIGIEANGAHWGFYKPTLEVASRVRLARRRRRRRAGMGFRSFGHAILNKSGLTIISPIMLMRMQPSSVHTWSTSDSLPKVRAGEAQRRRDTKRTQTDSVVGNFQPAALMQLGHEAAERQSLVISAPFPPAAS
jgi:hypothetical protein